jgi:hypothetical protein
MDLRAEAALLATRFQQGPVSAETRAQFIRFRTAMFERGIYDPVLSRFDSHTVQTAEPAEIGAQLEALAQSL